MSNTTFTISTTTELLDEIKKKHRNVSNFFNESAKYRLKEYRTQKRTEFMWYIALPCLGFLTTVGLTLYFLSLFFYIVMGICGIYLMIFGFLYYDKYHRMDRYEYYNK